MKVKTKKGARRLRNQKVRTNTFTQVKSPINGYAMYSGEVFEVSNLRSYTKVSGYTFTITSSKGTVMRTCLQRGCAHIQGNNWIIVPNYK